MKKIHGGHLNILAFLSNHWYREHFNYKNKDFGAQEPPKTLNGFEICLCYLLAV